MGFHRVLNIDCISYKKHEKYRDVHLGFMDPPFNIKRNYDVHDDDMDPFQFKMWLKDRISLTSFCIKPNGTLCLHGPDKLCMIYLEWLAQTKVWELTTWVNLYYGFGQCRTCWPATDSRRGRLVGLGPTASFHLHDRFADRSPCDLALFSLLGFWTDFG